METVKIPLVRPVTVLVESLPDDVGVVVDRSYVVYRLVTVLMLVESLPDDVVGATVITYAVYLLETVMRAVV